MREIIGNTTATPNPPSDWKQIDETKADFIKNKPNLGKLAEKDAIEKNDLAADIQESLNKANTAIQSVEGLATEDYVKEQITKIPTPDVSGQIDSHDNNIAAHNDIREAIPTLLSQLNSDETHRTVTDEEKASWNEKLDKTGGNISGDLVVAGDLTVKGTTKSEDHETILVEDNMVVLNSNKANLQTALSGVAMNKNSSSTYGAVYDPSDDTFKFGEGTLNEEKEFTFNEGEGLPFAVRNDSTQFVDGHIVRWSDDGNKLVDSGKTIDNFSAKEHGHDIEDVTGLQDTLDDKATLGETIVDDSVAYIKDVPSTSAKYAEVTEIGGMTRKCTNLFSGEISAKTAPTTYSFTNGTLKLLRNGGDIQGGAWSKEKYPKGTYTISFNLTGMSNANFILATTITASATTSGTWVKTWYANGQANYTFTLTEDRYIGFFTDGIGVEITAENVMLNEGSTTKPYEPYYEGLRDAKVTAVESVGKNVFGGIALGKKIKEIASGAVLNEQEKTIEYPASEVSECIIFDNFEPNTQYTFIFRGKGTAGFYNLAILYTDNTLRVFPQLSASNTIEDIRIVSDSSKSIARLIGEWNSGDTILYYEHCGIFKGNVALDDFSSYVKNTFEIPEVVQALEGYGHGINKEYYNKIVLDHTNGVKTYVKNVDIVDLGTLEWKLQDSNRFLSNNLPKASKAYGAGVVSVGVNAKYMANTWANVNSLSVDKTFALNNTSVYIADTSYTDVESFKAAMQGVMLVYELATPIETDVSDYFGDNIIGVEAGGTVAMVNEYSYDVPNILSFHTNTNEEIASNEFIGKLVGEASRAVCDSEGNNIVNTYATKDELSNVSGGGSAYILPEAGVSLGGVKSGGDVTISNGVISVNDDSHNHTIANVDNLQSSLDAKTDAIRWTCPTKVNAYSRICKLTQYGLGLLTLIFDQNSQAVVHTYLVGTSYGCATLSQIGTNGYSQYYNQTVRIVKGSSEVEFIIEVLNGFGYNGATTLDVRCTYTPLTNNTTCTPYNSYTATASSVVVSSAVASVNDGMVAPKFYGDLIGTANVANSATKATQDSNGNNIVSTYATKTELANHQFVNTARNIVGIVYPQTIATPADTHALRYDSAFPAANAGMFYSSNNANGIITFNKHEGLFDSQLGFNADGNIFYRCFNNTAIDESTPWNTIAYTSSKVAAATAADAADKANTATSATYALFEASTGNALIHAGNIGSQSVNYANSAGSASSATTASKCTGNAATATNVAWSGVTSKPSYYDAKAIKGITRNGTTFTYTCMDGTTGTFTQQDNNTTYSAATQSAQGLMSAADKKKLDGIASGANNYTYTLPTASSSTLGGVKTTSTVTSASGYTACPIISGVPYYKDTNTTYTLGSFGITATAAELNYTDGVTSNIQTQLNAKQAKPSTVTGSGAISVTLADNTEYRYTGVTSLTLAYKSDIFESWIKITVGTGANATVVFPPGTTYIGDIPTFAAGKTYEISIKDKIAVIGEVG